MTGPAALPTQPVAQPAAAPEPAPVSLPGEQEPISALIPSAEPPESGAPAPVVQVEPVPPEPLRLPDGTTFANQYEMMAAMAADRARLDAMRTTLQQVVGPLTQPPPQPEAPPIEDVIRERMLGAQTPEELAAAISEGLRTLRTGMEEARREAVEREETRQNVASYHAAMAQFPELDMGRNPISDQIYRQEQPQNVRQHLLMVLGAMALQQRAQQAQNPFMSAPAAQPQLAAPQLPQVAPVYRPAPGPTSLPTGSIRPPAPPPTDPPQIALAMREWYQRKVGRGITPSQDEINTMRRVLYADAGAREPVENDSRIPPEFRTIVRPQ